ncbi:hypothetical protein ACFZDG_39505 [Kitasatospora xanthocidica]|uniref:hypothetical protein n=1 Tax=Kitasatospora xanthocidica TaxID=83382 RepID=UPI0036EDBD41
MAYLATRPDTAATTWRGRAVHLTELQTRYSRQESDDPDRRWERGEQRCLANTSFDWQLADIRLTADPERRSPGGTT